MFQHIKPGFGEKGLVQNMENYVNKTSGTEEDPLVSGFTKLLPIYRCLMYTMD